MLGNAVISALLNVLLLAGIPFLFYFVYHKRRHKRGAGEIAQRAGLQRSEGRYIGYSVAFTLVLIVAFLIWSPPLDVLTREGSAWHAFAGLGLGGSAIAMVLLYGVVKTGFAEEFLFRGLIAGSLSRRLSLRWANVVQALIFLAPHLLLLFIMPEMWWLMLFIFATALFKGWVRIKSGSIIGPWLIHATLNVTMGLSVVIGTAP